MTKDPIKILFTGDFCPINRTEELALKGDYSSIFNDLIDVFRDNDLNVTDLECPLTLSESGRPKTGPHQKAHPETVRILNYARIELAAMANNHIMDYGSAGAKDTIELCRENGISTLGIGSTIDEAAQPFSYHVKGKKIAILNYADNEFLTTPDGAYTCNPIDLLRCFYDISHARKDHDYIIVIMHAGNEFYELPSPRTKMLYRCIIDMGSDAIISHHTHAFSGYEIYRSKHIFYGLGNFIYDWPGKRDERWNQGLLVRLIISEKVDFEIIPVIQSNHQPGVWHLNSDETDSFKDEINRLNQIIKDDVMLESKFQSYYKSVRPMYDAFIEPNFGKYITFLRKRGFFPKLLSHRKRLLLLNLTRCESHRDVLMKMLKEYE